MNNILSLWKKMFDEPKLVSLPVEMLHTGIRKVSGSMYLSHSAAETNEPVLQVTWVRRDEPVAKPKVRFINREVEAL